MERFRQPPFVGNHRPVDLLFERFLAISRSQKPFPEIVVLLGDSGVGKTRVIQEFYRRLVTEYELSGNHHPPSIEPASFAPGLDAVGQLDSVRRAIVPANEDRHPNDSPRFLWIATSLPERLSGEDALLLPSLQKSLATYSEWREKQGGWKGRVGLGKKIAAIGMTALDSGVGDLFSSEGLDEGIAELMEPSARKEYVAFTEALNLEMGYRADVERYRGNAADEILPAVLAIDDAHNLDESGASQLLRIVAGGDDSRRPLLLVLATSRSRLSSPAAPISAFLKHAQERFSQVGPPERLNSITLSCGRSPGAAGQDYVQLQEQDLYQVLKECFPEVTNRDEICERIWNRLRQSGATPLAVMRVCAQAADRIEEESIVDTEWAERVDFEPELKRLAAQLAAKERRLLNALVAFAHPALKAWLPEEESQSVGRLRDLGFLEEREGVLAVTPGWLNRETGPPSEDPPGLTEILRDQAALALPELLRADVDVPAHGPRQASLGRGLILDRSVLLAAPADSATSRLASIVPADLSPSLPLDALLTKDQRAELLEIAKAEPVLTAHLALPLIGSLIQAGHSGGGYAFVMELSREILRGLPEAEPFGELARRSCQAFLTAMPLDDLVDEIEDEPTLRVRLPKILLEHALDSLVFTRALIRCVDDALIDEVSEPGLTRLLGEVAVRWPKQARELIQLAQSTTRQALEESYRAELERRPNLAAAGSLLPIANNLTAATRDLVRDQALVLSQQILEAVKEDRDSISPSEIRAAQAAIRNLWRNRDHFASDQGVAKSIRELALTVTEQDDDLALDLLSHSTGDDRRRLWDAVVARVKNSSDGEVLIRLLKLADDDGYETKAVMVLLRERAGTDAKVAASWLEWHERRRSRHEFAKDHRDAFHAVLSHAEGDHPELFGTALRAAPDRATRAIARELTRSAMSRTPDLAVTLVQNRVVEDDLGAIRSALRRAVEQSPRAALALIRVAGDETDVELAVSSMQRLLEVDPDGAVEALLADPDPWITRLVAPGALLDEVEKRLHQRAMAGQPRAVGHLLELGLSAVGGHILRVPLDRLGPREILARARRTETLRSRRALRAQIEALTAEEPDSVALAVGILELGTAGSRGYDAAVSVLMEEVGRRSGVAATLVEYGFKGDDITDALSAEAAADPSSAVALHQISGESARQHLSVFRIWHTPSMIAWVEGDRDAAEVVAKDDVVVRAALCLTAPVSTDSKTLMLVIPDAQSERAKILELMLEFDAETVAKRIKANDYRLVAEGLLDLARRRPACSLRLVVLLLDLAVRVKLELRREIHRVIRWRVANLMAWSTEVARAAMRSSLHERLVGFDDQLADVVQVARTDILCVLAPIVRELERPDLTDKVAVRLETEMEARVASGDGSGLVPIAEAWSHVVDQDNRFTKQQLALLSRERHDPRAVAASLRTGSWQLRKDAARLAAAGDLNCAALLMRGDAAGANLEYLPPEVIRAFAEKVDDPGLLHEWLSAEWLRRKLQAEKELIRKLDERTKHLMGRSGALAAAVLGSKRKNLHRGARKSSMQNAMRTASLAGRVALLPTIAGDDLEKLINYLQDPTWLERSSHRRFVLCRVMVAREEHLVDAERLEDGGSSRLNLLRQSLAEWQQSDLVAAIANLLLADDVALPKAIAACREHDLAAPERFLSVLRVFVRGSLTEQKRSRIRAIYESGSPRGREVLVAIQVALRGPLPEVVEEAVAAGEVGPEPKALSEVRDVLKDLHGIRRADDRRRESAALLIQLRKSVTPLLAHAQRSRMAALLLADVADVLGHEPETTSVLVGWQDAAHRDEFLMRAAQGLRGHAKVAPELVEALRGRAAASREGAQAFSLIARGRKDREAADSALVGHANELKLSSGDSKRLRAHRIALVEPVERGKLIKGLLAEEKLPLDVEELLLPHLEADRAELRAADVLARRDIAGIALAIPQFAEAERREAFAWCMSLPRETGGRARLLMRLARSDLDLILATEVLLASHANPGAAIDVLFRDFRFVERIGLVAPLGHPLRREIRERSQRLIQSRPAARPAGWVTQYVAGVRLLISERAKGEIDGALGRLAVVAKKEPEAAVPLIDLLEHCDAMRIAIPKGIVNDAKRALEGAVAKRRSDALVRALVPGAVCKVSHGQTVREALYRGSALERADGLLHGRSEPFDELIMNPEVQDLFARSCGYPGRWQWENASAKEFANRRDFLQQAVREAWPRMSLRARVGALRTAPALVTSLSDARDVLEALEHVPETVPHRMNFGFIKRLESSPEERQPVIELLRSHGREFLSSAVALAELDPTNPRITRDRLETFRQDGNDRVLSALTAKPELTAIAHTLMAEPGDPLVDGIVEILASRESSKGQLSLNEMRLWAGIASELRPRDRGRVRTILRSSHFLTLAERCELLAQLAEDSLHHREVWEIIRDRSLSARLKKGSGRIEDRQLLDLARLRPAGLDPETLLAIDGVLDSLKGLEGLEARLTLRKDVAFPSDRVSDRLLERVMAQDDHDLLLSAAIILSHAESHDDSRHRAIEDIDKALRKRQICESDYRQLARIAPNLLPHEHHLLAEAIERLPEERTLDGAAAALMLGLSPLIESSVDVLLQVADKDLRAARALSGCEKLPAAVDLVDLVEKLSIWSQDHPQLAAATLWWLAVSSPHRGASVDGVLDRVRGAPRPEVFNAVIKRSPAASWLIRSFGTGDPFVWGLLDQALARASVSVEASVLVADLVTELAPTDIAAARAALRRHLEHPVALRALRGLVRTEQQRIEANEAWLSIGDVADDGPPEGPVSKDIYGIDRPGAGAVRLLHESRAAETLAELAAGVEEDPHAAPAATLVAAIELSTGQRRETLLNAAILRMTDDLAFGWALASARLLPDEQKMLARVLRSRERDAISTAVLVARLLGREMTDSDRARLAARLDGRPRETISSLLLIDPDTSWLEQVLSADRSGPLPHACAVAALAAIRAGADQPDLLKILAAADPEKFRTLVQEALPEMSSDEQTLRLVGSAVARDHADDRALVKRVSERIKASGVQGLDDVLGHLHFISQPRERMQAQAQDEWAAEDGLIGDVKAWRQLFRETLDEEWPTLPASISHIGVDVVERVMRPKTLERMIAFMRFEAQQSWQRATPVQVARCLRLRRNLHDFGERLYLPPDIIQRVEPLLEHADVLAEAFHLPISLLPSRGAVDLFALLEAADIQLGRESLPVADALVEVLVSGHPLDDRVPLDLRRRSILLLESADAPVFLIRAIQQGSERALDRLKSRLRDKDEEAAAALAQQWPLADPSHPLVKLALQVPRGALEFDRRVARLHDVVLRKNWEPSVMSAIRRCARTNFACAARAAQMAPEADITRNRDLLRDFVEENDAEQVSEALRELAQLGRRPGYQELVLEALDSAIENEDVALALFFAGGAPAPDEKIDGPLHQKAVEILWDTALQDVAVAHVLHAVVSPRQRVLLRHEHIRDAHRLSALPMAVSGLLDAQIDGEERREIGSYLDMKYASEEGSRSVIDACLVAYTTGYGRVIDALASETLTEVAQRLEKRALNRSARVALSALRWRAACQGMTGDIHRFKDDIPEVKELVRLAAAGPGGIEKLSKRTDLSSVAAWWSKLGFESIARDLFVPQSFAASSVTSPTSESEGRVIELLTSSAKVEWRGLDALVPWTELMLALAPPETKWQPVSSLDGYGGNLETGTRVILCAVPAPQGIDAVLLTRPSVATAISLGHLPQVEEGDVIPGVVIDSAWTDCRSEARLWLPAFPGDAQGSVLEPKALSVDERSMRRAMFTFLEVPVRVGKPKKRGAKYPKDFALSIDLRYDSEQGNDGVLGG